MGLTPNRLARRTARASARIGPWPRRLAALVCLLLAAGSALTPAPPGPAHPAVGYASRLHAGEVALPVPVAAAGVDLVRPGLQIGLLAQHRLVADRLRVLAVHPGDQTLSGDSSAVVVVAVSRSRAATIAGSATDRLVLIVDELP
ncbi:MAG TPA: hypothetical protein VIG48_00645 [Jatrophihabitans sp.]|jgi:hypothetical protein